MGYVGVVVAKHLWRSPKGLVKAHCAGEPVLGAFMLHFTMAWFPALLLCLRGSGGSKLSRCFQI